eukprot:218513-Prorocentrum_minimum.AAC.1
MTNNDNNRVSVSLKNLVRREETNTTCWGGWGPGGGRRLEPGRGPKRAEGNEGSQHAGRERRRGRQAGRQAGAADGEGS